MGNKLERLAAEIFGRYSMATDGRRASWEHLPKERKLAWMAEVIFYVENISDQLKDRFSRPPKFDPASTSYALGYNQGIALERAEIFKFIEELDEGLKKEFTEYKNNKHN